MLSTHAIKFHTELKRNSSSQESFYQQIQALGHPVVIITDEVVSHIHAKKYLQGLLSRGIEAHLLDFPSGEEYKTRLTKECLEDQLFDLKIDQTALLLGIGGGVVTDVTGFLASTFLRGISHAFIPTTFLAMVDAAFGGKTGVNTPHGKNLIGSCYFPKKIWIDVCLLETLDNVQMSYGMVETIKHALIADGDLFEELEEINPSQLRSHSELLENIIAKSISLKANIVARSYEDRGVRDLLNLGHTFGHALEAASSYQISHGRSVAIGCLVEMWYSWKKGYLPYEAIDRVVALFKKMEIDYSWPESVDVELLLDAMSRDKKVRSRENYMPLVIEIGKTLHINQQHVYHVDPHDLLEGVESLYGFRTLLRG